MRLPLADRITLMGGGDEMTWKSNYFYPRSVGKGFCVHRLTSKRRQFGHRLFASNGTSMTFSFFMRNQADMLSRLFIKTKRPTSLNRIFKAQKVGWTIRQLNSYDCNVDSVLRQLLVGYLRVCADLFDRLVGGCTRSLLACVAVGQEDLLHFEQSKADELSGQSSPNDQAFCLCWDSARQFIPAHWALLDVLTCLDGAGHLCHVSTSLLSSPLRLVPSS
ncbi:unnamed protein product [Protopolystoma xenopodis]|uniref:Uncharacterized protein n=1 Tax=Protopolystoma xenopodis TaxID=117903 RepID=A0A448WXH8_9PLAT|nr:unnamed protein product [Protopolystoma xenopodis]